MQRNNEPKTGDIEKNISAHEESQDMRALLYAYGELPAEEEKTFLAHLNNCKECQQILFASSAARAALCDVKAPELSLNPSMRQKESGLKYARAFARGLNKTFNAGLDAAPQPARFRLSASFLTAAAALVFVFAGAFFYNAHTPQTAVQEKEIYAASVAEEDFIDSMNNNLDAIETEVEGIETYISQIQ